MYFAIPEVRNIISLKFPDVTCKFASCRPLMLHSEEHLKDRRQFIKEEATHTSSSLPPPPPTSLLITGRNFRTMKSFRRGLQKENGWMENFKQENGIVL
jgi:hypothetical protein